MSDLDAEFLECVLEDLCDRFESDMPSELWRDVLYALNLLRVYRTKIAERLC